MKTELQITKRIQKERVTNAENDMKRCRDMYNDAMAEQHEFIQKISELEAENMKLVQKISEMKVNHSLALTKKVASHTDVKNKNEDLKKEKKELQLLNSGLKNQLNIQNVGMKRLHLELEKYRKQADKAKLKAYDVENEKELIEAKAQARVHELQFKAQLKAQETEDKKKVSYSFLFCLLLYHNLDSSSHLSIRHKLIEQTWLQIDYSMRLVLLEMLVE